MAYLQKYPVVNGVQIIIDEHMNSSMEEITFNTNPVVLREEDNEGGRQKKTIPKKR